MKYRLTPGKYRDEDVKDFWKATCKQSYSHQSNTNFKNNFCRHGVLWRGGPMPRHTWHIG